MAGVKGRSGGPRPNSGGTRPGAGRPRKNPVDDDVSMPVTETDDMLELLKMIALGQIEVSKNQLRAAIAAVQYTHVKKGEGGKKEAQQEAAEEVAGRFNRQPPPKLVAKNGMKVN